MAGVGLRETEELKRPLRFVECAPVGVRERVKAGWKEWGYKADRFCPGTVTAVNEDGSCAIKFDDGDVDDAVPARYILRANGQLATALTLCVTCPSQQKVKVLAPHCW
jgi:hypothetical protein